MKQLKIFHLEEPAWTEITIEWLLKYLQSEYPEMKFELFSCEVYTDEIRQTFTKKARCNFSIGKTASLTIWKNPVIIHMGVFKNYGNWCGQGEAVNSMEEFQKKLPMYINLCKEYAKNFSKVKEVNNAT